MNYSFVLRQPLIYKTIFVVLLLVVVSCKENPKQTQTESEEHKTIVNPEGGIGLKDVISSDRNTPIKRYGQLKVVGNKILSECDKPVQLAGMSLFWHQWSGKEFWNANAFRWLRDDWKIQYIRAPIGVEPEDGYLEDPLTAQTIINNAVKAAIDMEIYIIVDWHANDIHLDQAKDFFGRIAKEYGGYPNVIYEIFNEPSGNTPEDLDEKWPQLKQYSEEIITTIREYDPDNIIIVPTPFWDQLVDQAAKNPIAKDSKGEPVKNIAYSLHFYAREHGEQLRKRADFALSKGLPIWVTQCGRVGVNFAKPRFENANLPDIKSWNLWQKWMDDNNISYSKWSLGTKDETSSSLYPTANPNGYWTNTDLTPEGIWNRSHFRERYNKGWSPGCD
ncbi:glycoside hydrolase family 5 protein [Flavobacteriaceae bacterium F89]|uniref:Glycoside hydrolase family 5 protein n=1 Tax=Cerina litoralis TaxID=2874477 RepID=A0AAE3EVN3_9FLAO|nr:glycoside hydrolase family 5 protein [Cerina litoralis]MCG2460511.1 glycoside hydrolase family 5 protein [Cerina litoralis]